MAADAAIGSKITQALNAGSGVDINELATNLAEAESMAQIDRVTKKKEETSVSISGYAVLKAGVASLKSSLSSLQDKDSLLTKSVFTSNTNRVTATVSAQSTASAGTTKIKVNLLARPQQNTITDDGIAFTSLASSLAGSNFTINLKVPHGTSPGTTVNVTNLTPQGVIDAVNSVTTTTGVKARAANILASGTDFYILLEGKTGAVNSFAFSSSLSGSSELEGGDKNAATLAAQDLQVEVNDQLFKRDNNSPSDLIDGVQLNLKTASSNTTNIVVSESADSLETSLKSMVDSYNDLIKLTDYLTGDPDEEDELAGSLKKDRSTVNRVLSSARSLLNLTSATPSNGFSSLRHLGITSKLGGEIALKATTYAAAIKTNFSDVRTMLTGDTNDQAALSPSAKGLALDMSIILDSIVSNTGTIKAREDSVAKEITSYEKQLIDLQERFENVKLGYLKQFAAMETLVQRSKNTGEYLKSQFEAMQNSNN
jgi:flagellar hook-associated protein 2